MEDGWQPIETAPKDGTEVYAAHRPRWVVDGIRMKWLGESWGADFGKDGWIITFGQPTHWMPLPKAPA